MASRITNKAQMEQDEKDPVDHMDIKDKGVFVFLKGYFKEGLLIHYWSLREILHKFDIQNYTSILRVISKRRSKCEVKNQVDAMLIDKTKKMMHINITKVIFEFIERNKQIHTLNKKRIKIFKKHLLHS